MASIYASLACNLSTNLLQAALPLFEAGKVGAIEWSFDTLYQRNRLPDWFDELLRTYGEAGQLVGHGVFFSLFSGRWTADQQAWLNELKAVSARYPFDHITEHFGFMTGANFHTGAPLSVPLTAATLTIGQDRLRRIQDAARCPVGVENLAFAYSTDEVKRQGEFLRRLVEPVNGFLILDLHNLYCQGHNFGLELDELLSVYPLERVREIHLSGGSWEPSTSEPGRVVRRDTHDDAVPDTVFAYLAAALDRCPNLKYVVLEQLGSALATEPARQKFREDFEHMATRVASKSNELPYEPLNSFLPAERLLTSPVPEEDTQLYAQQRELAKILETAQSYQQARQLLASSSLAQSAWSVETWQPAMLETAIAIAQKWKNGFA